MTTSTNTLPPVYDLEPEANPVSAFDDRELPDALGSVDDCPDPDSIVLYVRHLAARFSVSYNASRPIAPNADELFSLALWYSHQAGQNDTAAGLFRFVRFLDRAARDWADLATRGVLERDRPQLEAVVAAASRVAEYTDRTEFNDQEHEDASRDLVDALARLNKSACTCGKPATVRGLCDDCHHSFYACHPAD